MRPTRKALKTPVIPDKAKRELVPVMEDRGIALYDAHSGEYVGQQDDLPRKYQPYDPEKADALGVLLGSGRPLMNSLAELGMNYSTYLRWLKTSEDFRSLINTSRTNRSMLIHDSFFENDINWLNENVKNYDDLSPSDVVELSGKMGLMSRKQKILKNFQEADSPNRFGKSVVTDEKHADVAIRVDMNLPDGLKRLVDHSFRPRLSEDGEFEIRGLPKDNELDNQKK